MFVIFLDLMAGVQVMILYVMNAKGGKKLKPYEIKNINKELNKRLKN